ncbi:MAG: DegT/DnrJ/EryC1/StrS family aminotransferase, partial [Actinoallomurus sp.]
RRLRFHGSTDKTTFTEVGYNSRLDALQAAVLRILLPDLDGWNEARRNVARAYAQNGLGDVDGIDLPRFEDEEHVFHLYVIRSDRADGRIHNIPRCVFGSVRRNRAASTAASRARGSNVEQIAWTSANPRSHRSGSGTFRSTAVPSKVVTASASGPTSKRSGSAPRTRASASRSGSFTSTFVVPRANRSPSNASLRTSRRA